MDVNSPINYRWPYAWPFEDRPIITPLIKALLECDYRALERLYQAGARFSTADEITLMATLYHVIGDHRTVEWVVNHGLVADYDLMLSDGDACVDYCLAPERYSWGLTARAWALGSFDTMDLLASRGFNDLHICIGGKSHDIDELICRSDDIRGMQILRENGYRICPWNPRDDNYRKLSTKYAGCAVLRDVEANPLVKRKSFGLDGALLRPISDPDLVKVRMFHRKEDQRFNELALADHKDRLRAQYEFAAKFSKTGRVKTQQEQDDEDGFIASIQIAAAKAHQGL